jgi:hypothetical protein
VTLTPSPFLQASELGVGQGRVTDPNIVGQDLVLKYFKYGDEKRKVEAWFKAAAKGSSATVGMPAPPSGGSGSNPLQSGSSGGDDGEEKASTNPLRAGRGRGRGGRGRGRGRGRG